MGNCDYVKSIKQTATINLLKKKLVRLIFLLCANFQENLRGNMTVLAHLGDRGGADACLLTQIFFLHILIDK